MTGIHSRCSVAIYYVSCLPYLKWLARLYILYYEYFSRPVAKFVIVVTLFKYWSLPITDDQCGHITDYNIKPCIIVWLCMSSVTPFKSLYFKPCAPGFLESLLSANVCMTACMCVCPPQGYE